MADRLAHTACCRCAARRVLSSYKEERMRRGAEAAAADLAKTGERRLKVVEEIYATPDESW